MRVRVASAGLATAKWASLLWLRGLPGGARALLPHKCYAALGAMAPHRPRPAGICSAGGSGSRHFEHTSLARRGTSRGPGHTGPLTPGHVCGRGVGAGPLPVPPSVSRRWRGGVVLPHPHGDGVAAGVRGVYPTATPSPRLRVPRVPAHAVGGVPARGIPPLDATAGAYVTSMDTFYVPY